MSCIYPALGLKTTKIDFYIHLIMDLPFFASSWVQKHPRVQVVEIRWQYLVVQVLPS